MVSQYRLDKRTGDPVDTSAEIGVETDSRQQTCELVHKYFPLSEKAMEKRLAELGR